VGFLAHDPTPGFSQAFEEQERDHREHKESEGATIRKIRNQVRRDE
jgi:hypothetical protein